MPELWGSVDGVTDGVWVVGWAALHGQDDAPPVEVVATLNGVTIGSGPGHFHREDVRHVRGGNVGFSFRLDRTVLPRDIITGQFRLAGTIAEAELGVLPVGRYFLRTIALEFVKTGLQHLETATRLIDEPSLNEALSRGETPVPPDLAPALMPWFREIYRDDRECVSAHLNSDPFGTTASVAHAVLSRFESLGANCEFGLVQRHFGVETIGLLRWGASIGLLPGVTSALRQRFEGIGRSVSLRIVNDEYISHEDKYQLIFHSDRFVGRDNPDVLIRNERVRIPYLARKLLEDIEDGQKIFVYKAVFESDFGEVLALSDAMREIGSAPLLWVALADRAAQIGTVETIRPNLFKGYIDRFSPPGNIYEYCSYTVWVTICRNAVRLWAEQS